MRKYLLFQPSVNIVELRDALVWCERLWSERFQSENQVFDDTSVSNAEKLTQ